MANIYEGMNVRQKLAKARLQFLNQKVKKSGKNMHLEFKYFELEDIVPPAIRNIAACMSSKTDNWATPQDFFDKLNEEFHFTLDPCADSENHKCDLFFTREQNGLNQDWGGHTVFCNPPYGREIADWVKYAYEQSQKPDTTVVMLIPARTDTRYFHEYIYI